MPPIPTHAVVWLDFHEAKIFLITAEDVERQRIKAHEAGSGHVRDDRKYFEAILAAIEDADSWLIVGPGETKKDLEEYLDGHGAGLKAHDRMVPRDPRIERAMRGGTARG